MYEPELNNLLEELKKKDKIIRLVIYVCDVKKLISFIKLNETITYEKIRKMSTELNIKGENLYSYKGYKYTPAVDSYSVLEIYLDTFDFQQKLKSR